MNPDTAPAIPEEVVEYLEKTFPANALKPNMIATEMFVLAGKLEVVKHLRKLCDEQNPLLQ